MRLLKLSKLLAPVGLAACVLSMNPEASQGQFPGGGRDGGGKRGGRDGGQGNPYPTAGQIPGSTAPSGFGGTGGQDGGNRFGRGDRGNNGGGFGGGATGGGFGGGTPGGGFGGGGFGRGGGGFDPNTMADSSFARLQGSYGGTGDTLDYSKIPAQTREQTNAMAQRFGGEAMPSSGSITKDQYRDQIAKRMQARTTGAATTTSLSTTPAPGGFPGSTPGGGFPGGGGGFPGGGGRGGFDPSQMTDDQIRQMMQRYDTDGDGRISQQEAQASDRLRDSFQVYDTNRDGFIDTTEYRAYIVARMSGGGGNGRPGDPNASMSGGWNQGGGGWNQGGGWGPQDNRTLPPQEEPKPVVLRYGKLPKELPSWFKQLDTDEDGQVGLYEWRRGERPTTEFTAMDLNGDGLLTAEEYLRFKNPNFTLASLSTGKDDRGGAGGAGGPGGPGGAGGSDGRSSDRADRSDRGSEKTPDKVDRSSEPPRRSGGLSGLFGGSSERPSSGGNPFNPAGKADKAAEKDNKKDSRTRVPGGAPGSGPSRGGRSE